MSLGGVALAVVALLALVGGGSLLGAHAGESPGLLGGPLALLQSASTPSDARAAIARVDRGLVDISTSFGLAHAQGAATGMIITPGGLVLTNNHVVNGATRVMATSVGTGRTYTAVVLGYDRSRDVALLQLQGASGLATVPLGDPATLRVGARVTALGNAGGAGGLPKAAPGLITALDRTIVAGEAGGANAERLTGMIQTNAHIIGGDSGGPLVDATGRVVGMNAASSAGPGRSSQSVTGFAIPIDTALSVARQVSSGQAGGTVHIGPTAFLGVAVVPDSAVPHAVRGVPQTGGAVVGGLVPGYPAERTGLARGDVITAVGGRAVTSGAGLSLVLGRFHPGDVVVLQWRDVVGGQHSAPVKLAEGPPA